LEIRRRINVSTSVKGIKSYDCTIEMVDPMADPLQLIAAQEVVLKMSDLMVAELDKRYPAVPETVKEK